MEEKLRVLYAEDSAADADLTKVHFEQHAPEIELDVVNTGQACLARLEDARYDVLLLDNRLPDMDAIAVLKELSTKEVPPVVVVTGTGDEALVVQVLRLGACNYVPKTGNYLESLPAVLEKTAAEFRRLREEGRTAGPRHRHILYVEHNEADIDLTLRHFAESAAHLDVKAVRSSREALQYLPGEFDLVLADLRMPDMNALDLLREANDKGVRVPFIIITGRGHEAAAVAALKLGAYDYMVKRDNYLTQLPYAIENAITRAQLAETNRSLETQLAERARAEAEVARLLAEAEGQRRRLDEIIASVPGLVWETWGCPGEAEHKAGFVSKPLEGMLGYTAAQWLSGPDFWQGILHPEDRDRVAREMAGFFAGGHGGTIQFRSIANDGRVVWVEIRSTVIFDDRRQPVGMRGVALDLTAAKEAEQARTQLEAQLRQVQKMESIGRLAGGVAHDFNNLLTVINGYADMLLADLVPDDPRHARVVEIRRSGERGSALTRQLLAFSRSQVLQPRVLDLNALIADGAKMLKRLLGEDIELVSNLDPGLGRVKADPGQMDQVILNLAVNARDAMPEGGKLTLKTRNVRLDGEHARQPLMLDPGPYVVLTIADTGSGMDPQTIAHCFEPFFTTKEAGKGTGLGLSTVYGIVKQSGGSVWACSDPGNGTTFEVYLPQVEEPVAEQPEDPRAAPPAPQGNATILLVEDEELVRRLTADVLSRQGYRVIEAANGAEALLAAEKHGEPIPLAITDVVMPGMTGWDLAVRLRGLRPEMRFLYMSGYAEDSIVRAGLRDPAVPFLQKPFTPAALVAKVREVLEKHAPPATVPSPLPKRGTA